MTLTSPIATNRYLVERLLGSGCWGDVYKMHDTFLEEGVAVKVFNPNTIAQKQMKTRMTNELKTMAKEAGEFRPTKHVVPRRFEVDANNKPYIVMPVYDRMFSDIIDEHGERKYSRNGLTLDDITKWAMDISLGIHEVHTYHGRVHGDIKPDNIAVDPIDGLKLTDFGIATVLANGSEDPRDNMGFPHTRAPENFQDGDHPTPKHDVYAFGSLLYRLFTGKYPSEVIPDLPEKYASRGAGEWYVTIADLVRDPQVPKPFRGLLRDSMAHEEFRIKNAASLVKRTEKAIKQYKRSLLPNRALRYGLYTTAVWALSVAAFVGAGKMQELREKQQENEFQRKWTIVRRYNGDFGTRSYDPNEALGVGELNQWAEKLGDRRSAMAAYMNPEAFYEAAQITQTYTYDSLQSALARLDSRLELYIRLKDSHAIDSWMWTGYGEFRKRVETQWGHAAEKYEQKQRARADKMADTSSFTLPAIGPVSVFYDSTGAQVMRFGQLKD